MGQKVNPIGYRIGTSLTWQSKWFAEPREYSNTILEDYKVRKMLNKQLASAGLVKVAIERSLTAIKIILFVSKRSALSFCLLRFI